MYNKKENMDKLVQFSLKTYQKFVRNYLHPNTPYKNILLYWSPGSGKTFGTLAITEQYADFIKMFIWFFLGLIKFRILTCTIRVPHKTIIFNCKTMSVPKVNRNAVSGIPKISDFSEHRH
jgi:hypothetical protein